MSNRLSRKHSLTIATTDRIQKLKDARSEAAKEIEEYKASKEAEFAKFENDVSVGSK